VDECKPLEVGMVHTVLSDKTGTLTCNSMEFFKVGRCRLN
jgi:P-type E1-E2 ATPase